MKAQRIFRSYRKKLKKMVARPLKEVGRAKQVNLKMIKVCFGPCRCFSAAKR